MKRIFIFSLVIVFVSATITVYGQDKSGSNKTTTTKDSKTKPAQVSSVKSTTKPGGKDVVKTDPAQAGIKGNPLTLLDVEKNAQPVVEQKPNGSINWTEQYIEAKGSSAIDNERFKIPAQAKAMATRGAVVIAQRNLLEMINGVNVTSETTVQDMVTKSDYIYTRVDGLIKGARQVGEPIEKDGMVEVTMRVPLYAKDGLAPVVYNELPQIKDRSAVAADPNAQPVVDDKTLKGSEGLVFNLNGQQIDPSMFPVVVDEQGNLLLDMTKLYDPKTGKFPQVLKTSKTLFNDLGFQKGVDVIDAVQGKDGKIVLDSKNSKKFDWGKVGNVVGSIAKFLLMLF
jgi:hypothetical protein